MSEKRRKQIEAIVKVALNKPNHPLHEFFEWDDKIAALKLKQKDKS